MTVEHRGGRLSAAPIELEAEQADALRERLPGADYEWRSKTVSIRVPPDAGARLAAALALAEGVTQAHTVGDPAKADSDGPRRRTSPRQAGGL